VECSDHGDIDFSCGTTLEPGRPRTEDPAPLRAVHTPNFPALLRQLGASLLVTTYQAGKLVLVRDEGDHLNTHFRGFQAPMGMALSGDRLAVGTAIQAWEFVDVPAVTAKLEPPGRHDGCFLPRSSHVCVRRSDDTNGTSLGANRYRAWTCEQRLFLLLGLDSRGLHLKPSVSHQIK
jgi:hypothetical protein